MSLKKEQIRIGQFLRYEPLPGEDAVSDFSYGKVLGIDRYGFVDLDVDGIVKNYDCKRCKGITLTSEWLERLGVKRTDYDSEYNFLNGILEKNLHGFTYFVLGDMEIIHMMKIDFVHELQDMYFIKEKKHLKIETPENHKPF